jgi:hypothetical protein
MADRTVKVNLLANVTQYERSVESAAEETDRLRRKAERFDGKRYKARLDVETKDADKALKDWARKVEKFRRDQERADKKAAADKAREEKKQLDLSLRRMSNAMKEMKRQQAADLEASKVRVDTSGAMSDLAAMRNEANSLDRDNASPEVNLQIDKFLLDARRVENELNRLSAEEATPEADLKADKLHFEIQKIRNELRKIDEEQSRITVTADTSKAREQLRQLNADLNSLNMKKASPEAEMKIQKFRAQALQIEREIEKLSRMEASADVDLQTAGAQAKLAAINAELRRFDGRTFRSTVDINTKGSQGRIGMLIAAISGMSPLIAATAATGGAAMIGLAGAFTVAAAGAGVVGLAFAGIGNALEAANEYAIDPSEKNLKKLNNTLNQLSDSQRNFYNFIQGSLKPALEQLQATAADGLLPGVQEGAQQLLAILPEINNVIGKTGQALGQMAASAGESLNDPVWRNWFNFIGNEATTQLVAFAESIGNFIQGFAAMQMAFNPFTQDIINGLRGMSQEFTAWAQSLQGTAEFEEFLNYVRTVGPQVMETFGALAGAIGAIIEAGAPLGPMFLNIITVFADLVSTLADIPVVGTALIGLATGLGVLNLALRATAGMRAGAASLAAGIAAMGGGARAATPAVAALGAASTKAGTQVAGVGRQAAAARVGLSGVASSAMLAGGGMRQAGTASRTAGGAMNALKTAGGAVARNLPIIGAAALGLAAAYDQMNTSATEGASALTDQGAAAASTRAELQANSAKHAEYVASMGPMMGAVREWATSLLGTETTMEQANAEFERQIATMAPLEAATARQQQAQNLLNDAIRQYGPMSSQAADAQRRLAEATGEVQLQQELAGQSGMQYMQTLGRVAQQNDEAGAAARRHIAGLTATEVAATGARMGVDQFGNAIAILPDGKTVVINADTMNTSTAIASVGQQLGALPANTPIRVNALTAEAQGMLRSLGLEVTQMPDGSFTVIARTEEARQRATDLGLQISGMQPRFNVGANVTPAQGDIHATQNLASQRQTFLLGADGAGAISTTQGIIGMVTQPQNMPVGADASAAGPPIFGAQQLAQQPQTMPVGADASGTVPPILGAEAMAQAQRTMPVDANVGGTVPPIASAEANAQAQRTMPVDGNVAGTVAPIAGAEANAQRQRTMPVDANTSRAQGQISGFWNSWAGRTITWFVNLVGGNAKGAIWDNGVAAMANGGVLNKRPIEAFAAGDTASPYNRNFGNKKLRSMPGGGARMVPPNTWRVVGDRMDVPELYAPLDGSGRSLQLIAQGARTFGKTLVDISAMQSLMGNKWNVPTTASIPRPVNVAREMALSGGGSSTKQVTNNVTINNPIAERGSDSVQSRLSRLADLGLFGDD